MQIYGPARLVETPNGAKFVEGHTVFPDGERIFAPNNRMAIVGMVGQSLAVGPSGTPVPNREPWSVFMPSGLTMDGGTAISVVQGPNGSPIDSCTATGLVPATNINSNGGAQRASLDYLFAMCLMRHDREHGNPTDPLCVMNAAALGRSMEQLDNDPATGLDADTTPWQGFTRITQAKKDRIATMGMNVEPGVFLLYQGHANRTSSEGEWAGLVVGPDALFDDVDAFYGSMCLAPPDKVVIQSPGDRDTTIESWNVKQAQINEAMMARAIFGGATYNSELSDGVHPTITAAMDNADRAAFLYARHKAGLPGIDPEPTVTNNVHGVNFAWKLTDGTAIKKALSDDYGVNGDGDGASIHSFGFLLTGANSSVQRAAVTIPNGTSIQTYWRENGTPTPVAGRQVHYASQRQSVNDGKSAHRGCVYFPDFSFPSTFDNARTVRCYAPSFKTETI